MWKDAEGKITCSAARLLGQLRAIGISSEKMPLALNLFVNLYFGSVESKTMQFLVPSSQLATKVMDYSYKMSARFLVEKLLSDTTALAMTLLPDESEKKKAPLMLKLIAISEVDRVYLTNLDSDTMSTKKATNAALHTFNSLLEQLGVGALLKITGATSEGPRTILSLIDNESTEYEKTNPGAQIRQSYKKPGLIFNRRGKMREFRLMNCAPHLNDRMWQHFLTCIASRLMVLFMMTV
jgi:hypothetical protein